MQMNIYAACFILLFSNTVESFTLASRFCILRRSKSDVALARTSAIKTSSSIKLKMVDSTSIYELQNWAGTVASQELTHISPLSIGVMYVTGLLMSLSPCALSLLPLTIAYIMGSDGDSKSRGSFLPSLAFAGGLATVLSAFGLSATYAGKLFGSAGMGSETGGLALPLLSSLVAILAGLNILDLINITLPSIETGMESLNKLSPTVRAYALGASSALIASPCCTPVLASILGFVASSQDPILGLLLLLSYSLGYTTPVIIAGAASGSLNKMMSMDGLTWISPVSAAVLISYGTYSGLEAIYSVL